MLSFWLASKCISPCSPQSVDLVGFIDSMHGQVGPIDHIRCPFSRLRVSATFGSLVTTKAIDRIDAGLHGSLPTVFHGVLGVIFSGSVPCLAVRFRRHVSLHAPTACACTLSRVRAVALAATVFAANAGTVLRLRGFKRVATGHCLRVGMSPQGYRRAVASHDDTCIVFVLFWTEPQSCRDVEEAVLRRGVVGLC